jgi:hypothetical protein
MSSKHVDKIGSITIFSHTGLLDKIRDFRFIGAYRKCPRFTMTIILTESHPVFTQSDINISTIDTHVSRENVNNQKYFTQ